MPPVSQVVGPKAADLANKATGGKFDEHFDSAADKLGSRSIVVS